MRGRIIFGSLKSVCFLTTSLLSPLTNTLRISLFAYVKRRKKKKKKGRGTSKKSLAFRSKNIWMDAYRAKVVLLLKNQEHGGMEG